jgi:ParB family chromosome partitioning protein
MSELTINRLAVFKEPFFGYEQEFLVAPVDALAVISHQRKPSDFHVKRLAESMKRVGFVTPLTCIRADDGKLIVIDGQHRLLAAKMLGAKAVPCVIIPNKYAVKLMELNVEKTMNLREKAYVARNVYMELLSKSPQLPENDALVLDSIEYPYYVTVGFAYEQNERLYGSAFESILRRVDGYTALPLQRALEERRRRASLLLQCDAELRHAIDALRAAGFDHPFIHREAVTFCSPIGRRRKVSEGFDDVMQRLLQNLRELASNPQRFRPSEGLAEPE